MLSSRGFCPNVAPGAKADKRRHWIEPPWRALWQRLAGADALTSPGNGNRGLRGDLQKKLSDGAQNLPRTHAPGEMNGRQIRMKEKILFSARDRQSTPPNELNGGASIVGDAGGIIRASPKTMGDRFFPLGAFLDRRASKTMPPIGGFAAQMPPRKKRAMHNFREA